MANDRDELDKSVAAASVSIAIYSLALLRLITAASVFWIACNCAATPRGRTFLRISVAALSCAYAAYGLFAFVYMPGAFFGLHRRFRAWALLLRLSFIPTLLRPMLAWVWS